MNVHHFLLSLASIIGAASCFAGEPVFRRHDLNPQSRFPAAAALDVNRDGKLDILCGGWWYEAPTWKRHFVRDVEQIRGRFDDYSNLPMDVDRDGWTDIVSVNYRSESLYWTKNPGPGAVQGEEWTKHQIDAPGPSETGRLVDVDGDGRLDILPNGAKFAAWYELDWLDAEASPATPLWIRHDLPPQAIGHGVGLGDIDGDGRKDIVTTRGWLKAPEDRRKGQWVWRGEFQLHRDGSIPILVMDVDRDGDNDVVWGRGHRTGVYWLEQGGADGSREWTWHAIDTSWSQAHSLIAADVDNDGQDEVVAGKRYMGHDGKDVGEFDPLVIYWYDFDTQTRTWRRGEVSAMGEAGFDTDPKAVDLDADGDVDILAPTRAGFSWFENLLADGETRAQRQARSQYSRAAEYPDHSKLLEYRDENDSLQRVFTSAEWAIRRSHILANMQKVMGPLPGPHRRTPLDVKVLSEEKTPNYIRRKVTFAAEPGDRVPALLLIPNDLKEKAPAMLCLHQTTKIGKEEPVGLGGKPNLHYAHELANRGFVCLALDYPSFGDYPYDFSQDDYVSGTMKAIWNNMRAVDLLESLPEVHPDRIGCIGHSLGGHNALFTAAFDLRIKAAVTSCGFTAFHDYYEGRLNGWTSDRYMPKIREEYGNDPDKVPFDFYEVIAAIAPRGVFSNSPLHDSNFEVNGVKRVIEKAEKVYRLLDAEEKLKAVYPDAGHDYPEAQREEAYGWLEKNLKGR